MCVSNLGVEKKKKKEIVNVCVCVCVWVVTIVKWGGFDYVSSEMNMYEYGDRLHNLPNLVW